MLTINGRTVIFATIFCAILTFFTLKKVISVLCEEETGRRLIVNFLYMTPLIGYLSVTLNHDILSSCGILLIFITLLVEKKWSGRKKIVLVFQISLALTSFIGLIGTLVILLIYSIRHRTRNFRTTMLSAFSIILFCSASFISIERPPLSVVLLPIISDVKCISQSDNSTISNQDWIVLKSIQSEASWREVESCSSANTALNEEFKNEAIDRDFIETYLRIATQNSLQIIQAHILRSSSAMPAPFLIPQSTTYDLAENTTQLGIQKQNGLLLTARSKYGETGLPIIRKVEPLAMFGASIVNFFSHIIGWGGLLILIVLLAPSSKRLERASLLTVLLSMHGFLFLWSPVNDNRYLLTTNLLAWVLIAQLIVQKFAREYSSIQDVERI